MEMEDLVSYEERLLSKYNDGECDDGGINARSKAQVLL